MIYLEFNNKVPLNHADKKTITLGQDISSLILAEKDISVFSNTRYLLANHHTAHQICDREGILNSLLLILLLLQLLQHYHISNT